MTRRGSESAETADPIAADLDLTPSAAVALQRDLQSRVVTAPPPGFSPRLVAGADLSVSRGSNVGFVGIVVLDAATRQPVDSAALRTTLRFPYIPGLLSFRELPAIEQVWQRLRRRPDVLIFDGVGLAHPRRLGIASHGGLRLGIPTIGCSKSLLVGEHGPLGEEAGATAPLVHRGEIVGTALRLRARVKPVYVSVGHLIDLATAVAVVQSVSAGFRLPETTRLAHRLVNDERSARERAGG